MTRTRRRQETRWIHRWSRPIIAGIAAVGASGTGYLTVVKLLGGNAACPTEGCDRVLSSPYATVFGLPLTLFGLLAYATMFALALVPLLVNLETNKELHQKLESMTWPLMFVVSLAMVVFSSYLMYILAFELKVPCLYCVTSALFALSMFTLTLLGRSWDDRGQLLFIGFIVAVVTLTSTLAIYAPIQGGGQANQNIPGEAGPPITTASGPAEIALARHLKSIDAKMFGAWWCPHCHEQKEFFGAEAATQLNYIECAADGQNPQPDLCKAEKITGFPTWKINGQLYSGRQSMQRLAEVSGYTGPQDFKQP